MYFLLSKLPTLVAIPVPDRPSRDYDLRRPMQQCMLMLNRRYVPILSSGSLAPEIYGLKYPCRHRRPWQRRNIYSELVFLKLVRKGAFGDPAE